ncbi:MAG: hypothetical protein PHW87_03720 [Methanothrix sp.]|nr:hypothetical protein [Methanothrix sp.]
MHQEIVSCDHRKMAELDALEVCYPRRIAGFCDDLLAGYSKG